MNKALRSTTTPGVSDEREVCVAFLLAAALVALMLLPGGDQRGAATYYPSSPVRGNIVIARLAEFPSSPI